MFGRLSVLSLCCALLAVTWGCGAPQTGTGGRIVGQRESAEPKQITLKQLLRQQARVWNVSYPILTAGADLCGGRVRQQYGFWAWTRWDIDRRYRTASMGAYGLDDYLRVVHIIPGSPAAKAGLLAGDVITAVGWHEMTTGRKASAGLQSALESETKPGAAMELHVTRGESEHTVRMSPEVQCDYSLILTESEQINVFTDGQDVFVTEGLLRFVPSDHDLAVLIGHTMAHRILGHEPGDGDKGMTDEVVIWLRELRALVRQTETNTADAMAGITPTSGPFGLQSEFEADDLGFYFAARAGYRVDRAGALWQHIATQNPQAVLMKAFHPTNPERLGAIDAIILEIERKKTAEQPLVPGL